MRYVILTSSDHIGCLLVHWFKVVAVNSHTRSELWLQNLQCNNHRMEPNILYATMTTYTLVVNPNLLDKLLTIKFAFFLPLFRRIFPLAHNFMIISATKYNRGLSNTGAT